MADAPVMLYNSNDAAQLYRDWYSRSLYKSAVEQTTFDYFGDLTGVRVVDFGCGNGVFLKQCLDKGASYCLGFDVNEPMINSGGNAAKQSDKNGPLRFVVQDCFKPIQQTYGRFDFALCHYVLCAANDETKLEICLKNVIGMLKPGGKLFIGEPPQCVKTLKDQKTIADLCGSFYPLEQEIVAEEGEAIDPGAAFYPAPIDVSKTGRPFTRRKMFSFRCDGFDWTKEKFMEHLKKVGFVKVALLPTSLPDDVPLVEKERIESLEEPFGFIGAEKPT